MAKASLRKSKNPVGISRGRAGGSAHIPKLGVNEPEMGTKYLNAAKLLRPPAAKRTSIAGALFTKTQQRVLGLLFGQPGRSFYASELIALTGGGSGAVHRELRRLVGSGIVTRVLKPLISAWSPMS